MNGKVHHFGPRGLYDGMVLISDDETNSYWNHVTGECVYGELEGERLQTFPIEHTTVKAAMNKYKDLKIALFNPSIKMKLLSFVMTRGKKKSFLPPGFEQTMGVLDDRLPKMSSGLGVILGEHQRFYPVDTVKSKGGTIYDSIHGRTVTVQLNPDAGVPQATFTDNQVEKPMQLFTRWYGFSLTYPNCEVYDG
ncbi:DUF3179 domain-containing protein [Alkalihalobacillus berkeleyi]|uniref:DUF3179 domain-containing protein n=1 Tax=Pseudalkalibacillus berkeleyi TaxID=1069813 RepID=A0ABS9H0B1_9BACL|nr:DUF3179 domain-containing protein [Pseudalkalibacillus berkeleyi]